MINSIIKKFESQIILITKYLYKGHHHHTSFWWYEKNQRINFSSASRKIEM